MSNYKIPSNYNCTLKFTNVTRGIRFIILDFDFRVKLKKKKKFDTNKQLN